MLGQKKTPTPDPLRSAVVDLTAELAHICEQIQPAEGTFATALLEHLDRLTDAVRSQAEATRVQAEAASVQTEGLELVRYRLERVDGRLEGLELFLAARFPDLYPHHRTAVNGTSSLGGT